MNLLQRGSRGRGRSGPESVDSGTGQRFARTAVLRVEGCRVGVFAEV